jgi:hypothetical protein
MKLQAHIERSLALYGRGDVEVHKHLDERYADEGSSHRRHRHTLEYVLNMVKSSGWNVFEARTAIQHLTDDCGRIMMEDDWKEAKDFILEAVQ